MEQKMTRFVYEGGIGEIEEKKSRFIAAVQPVHTEEEALAFLSAKKKEYYDARHNCHAFVIGESNQIQRCSDDGEPSGTAGRPMLEILLHEQLRDTIVVVTRYFGGTLLGTGGLVRAYQAAVQAGLAASRIAERRNGRELSIEAAYTDLDRLQRYAAKQAFTIHDSTYTENVTLKLMLPEAACQTVLAELTDLTEGRAKLSLGDPESYAEVDGNILRF
ncbi:MAG: YigZ family protein [Lachnospiraceae bacterium]|nr:YigZ family protein [Lachnospiraceae bacterium]